MNIIIQHCKRKYVNRHNILKVLKLRQKENFSLTPIEGDYELSVNAISEKTSISEQEIWDHIYILLAQDEIYEAGEEASPIYGSTSKGTNAVTDEKYLKTARKEFWEENFDVIRTLSAWIILIVTVATFSVTAYQTKKNTEDIKLLKNELKVLRDSITRVGK